MNHSIASEFSLHSLLSGYGISEERLVELFARHTRIRLAGKGEILLERGRVNQTAFYLIDGCAYQYELNDTGEERIIDLHITGDWVLNHSSFVGQRASEVCIKASSVCRLLEVRMEDIHYLISVSQKFIQLGRILEEVNTRVQYFDRQQTPYGKYEGLMKDRKELFGHFPLKMIASYLKITPETLSRVREKFVSAGKT
ncbi:MAG: hypothetical protein MUC87_04755 [Bacteroidia bacterium]|jgi:CRP-like cAMP-binding protein|nr:hypothetical protein [Bacteroidia bacterium]